MAVGTVHGLGAERAGVVPWREPSAGAAGTTGGRHHGVPGPVIIIIGRRRCHYRASAAVGSEILRANRNRMRQRRLELLGLVGVARVVGSAGGACRCQPGTAEQRPRRAAGVEVVVRVAVVGMALQADLVLARDIGFRTRPGGDSGIDGATGARVTTLDGEARRHRLERIARVDRLDTCGAAQHAGDKVAVHVTDGIFMAVRARLCIRVGRRKRARQPILSLDDPVRVVAVGAFGMPVGQVAKAELGARFHEVLAAIPDRSRGIGAIGVGTVIEDAADLMHFRAGRLVGTPDRHAARQREVRLDVGNGLRITGRVSHRRFATAGVALVAGFLDRGIAAGLGAGQAVGAFAGQAPRALYRVRIVAVQTPYLPDRRIRFGGGVQGGWKFTLLCRRRLVGLRRHLTIGMRRKRPRYAGLVVAGEADHIAGAVERAAGRLRYLEAVHAQEFGIAMAGGRISHMRIVAGRALHLVVFQRHFGFRGSRHTIPDNRAIGPA